MEDFESSSAKTKLDKGSDGSSAQGAWMCDLFERASMLEELEKTKNLESEDTYMPKPFSEVEIDEHAWMQVLATLDVSALPTGTQFCDDMGYDYIPVRMIQVMQTETSEIEPLHWIKDEITLTDISDDNGSGYCVDSKLSEQGELDDDPWVHETELEKVRILLKHRETMAFQESKPKGRTREERRKRQARSKGIKRPPPMLKGKNDYLYMVGAVDCIKAYNEWKTSFGLIQELKESKQKPQRNKPKKARTIAKQRDENKSGTPSERQSTTTKIVEDNRTHWEQKLPSVIWAYRCAYKTALHTTPFNLVYGLDAILPIEFLIPTLRVAHSLEWHGHELSKRIDELELLGETRARAVLGMYVEKRRQKRWHDTNLRTKEFHKGTLVLVYTLKQHKRKLKLRGLGPFVINEISPSGSIRLETLDGELMANHINGSRLRVYHEPLTDEMLSRLHAAKNRKTAHEEMVKATQEEAHARAQKLKQKRLYINNVKSASTTLTTSPTMPIGIEVEANLHNALLDSGADANIMPSSVYNRLRNKTTSVAQQTLYNFQQHQVDSLGLVSKLMYRAWNTLFGFMSWIADLIEPSYLASLGL